MTRSASWSVTRTETYSRRRLERDAFHAVRGSRGRRLSGGRPGGSVLRMQLQEVTYDEENGLYTLVARVNPGTPMDNYHLLVDNNLLSDVQPNAVSVQRGIDGTFSRRAHHRPAVHGPGGKRPLGPERRRLPGIQPRRPGHRRAVPGDRRDQPASAVLLRAHRRPGGGRRLLLGVRRRVRGVSQPACAHVHGPRPSRWLHQNSAKRRWSTTTGTTTSDVRSARPTTRSTTATCT